jgi:hypothetical protein
MSKYITFSTSGVSHLDITSFLNSPSGINQLEKASNAFNDDIRRPISEGSVKVSRDKSFGPNLDSIMTRVRPVLGGNDLPGILLSMVCSCAGKASAAIVANNLEEARNIAEEMARLSIKALAQIEEEV